MVLYKLCRKEFANLLCLSLCLIILIGFSSCSATKLDEPDNKVDEKKKSTSEPSMAQDKGEDEKKQVENKEEKDVKKANIPVGITQGEVPYDTPEAVMNYAIDLVKKKAGMQNFISDEKKKERGDYSIVEAKITKLAKVHQSDFDDKSAIVLYELEYRLLPDKPENVVLVDSMLDDKWITEFESTGQPVLAFAISLEKDKGERYIPLCAKNTMDVEHEYATAPMLESYKDKYTAMASELKIEHNSKIKEELKKEI